MAKKKVEKPRRELTKRQLAGWERQRRINRIVLIAGIVLIVAVLLTVGVGWFLSSYQPLHETVIRVNDVGFNMDYYIKMLKFYGRSQPDSIPYLTDAVAQAIQQNELVRQGAAGLEITASDDEVNKRLETSNPPLSKDYRDVVRAQILLEKMRDEYFGKQVPASAEQRHAMAMFLEGEKQASDIRARLLAGEDFGKLAEEFSLDNRSKSAKGDLGWHPKDVMGNAWGEKVLEERVFTAEVGLLSQPLRDADKVKMVGYWLVKLLDMKAEPKEAKVQGMLLGSADEGQSVRARLLAGEDFATVAKEVSQDSVSKESGGDLGQLPPGQKPALDQFLFESGAAVGALSQPIRDDTVQTAGGYWLVKVLEVESDREIDEQDHKLLASVALDGWLTSLPLDPQNRVENLLTDEQKSWAVLRATKELTRTKG